MNSVNVNFISLHEAAKLTNYSQDYISLLCRQKKLRGEKLGRNWVTTKEWVENYINKTKGSGQNIISVKIKDAPVENRHACSLQDKRASSLPQEVFFKKLILAVFAVGVFGIGFVFFQNSISHSMSQIFSESKKIMVGAFFNANSFLSSFDKNNIRKEFGTVAGVSEEMAGHSVSEENGIVIIPLEGEINSEENQKLIEKLSSSFSDDVEINPSGDGVSGVITSSENPDENYLYLMVPVESE